MNKYIQTPLYVLCVIAFTLSVILIIGCGGGGGGGSSGGGTTASRVSIDERFLEKTVTTPSIYLKGDVFDCPGCPPGESAFGYCPDITCPTTSNTSVSWINSATNESGVGNTAIARTCSCLFSQCTSVCVHKWGATVPIIFGNNNITVRKSGGTGSGDSVVITRVPNTPSDVWAVAGHGSVTVSWNSVPGAESYNIYWSTSRNIATNTANKVPGVVSPYTLTGLSDNVTYYFLVTAVYDGFESFASDTDQATAGWFTETLAETSDTTDERATSIAVDSANNAHIHYSYNEHIEPNAVYNYNYYISENVGGWDSVFVDNAVWVNANIVLDSSDIVHVSYLDFPGLTHGIYASGKWVTDVIDPDASCSTSLAIDSKDNLHSTYPATAYPNQLLQYANNTSGSWASATFDVYPQLGCGRLNGGLALAMDLTGTAHIAYAGGQPDNGLKYATNKGGIWSITDIDQGYIEQVSIAVDSDGEAHVVYADNISQLRYAQNVSGAWFIELLEDSGSPSYPSIAVDYTGKAHISYMHNLYGELRYTTNRSGVWQTIPIDLIGRAIPYHRYDTSITLDSLGKCYITYFRGGSLMFATNR